MLWYGTPDAPAPPEENAPRNGATLIVGVAPASPSNGVEVRYRIDGKGYRQLRARQLQLDARRSVQYFEATFPCLTSGQVVEFTPILYCSGRQVPPANVASGFISKFSLAESVAVPQTLASPDAPGMHPRFKPNLTYISAVTKKLSRQPDVIGVTPDGVRINFYLDGGRAVGPRFNATVLPRGADFLTVRTDGVGVVKVKAVFQTDDGYILDADYYGTVDLGPDGYERAAKGDFPRAAPIRVAPRFLGRTGPYEWMNRYQFVGIGEANLDIAEVDYDLFAVGRDANATLPEPFPSRAPRHE